MLFFLFVGRRWVFSIGKDPAHTERASFQAFSKWTEARLLLFFHSLWAQLFVQWSKLSSPTCHSVGGCVRCEHE